MKELLQQVALVYGAWAKYGYGSDITIRNINHLYNMAKDMDPALMQSAWDDYHALQRKIG